jgi:hypothetical protein
MSNNIELVAECWDGVKHFLNPMDRADAADTLVTILVDHNVEPDDIKEAFRGDKDVKQAVKQYLQENSDQEEHDDEDYDDHEEDDDY